MILTLTDTKLYHDADYLGQVIAMEAVLHADAALSHFGNYPAGPDPGGLLLDAGPDAGGNYPPHCYGDSQFADSDKYGESFANKHA